MKYDLLPKLEDVLDGREPEKVIKTSCQKCIFRQGDPQYGCEYYNRIEKFVDKNVVYTLDGYCGIGTFCNACTQKVPDGVDAVKYVDDMLSQQVDYIIEAGKLSDMVRTYESIVEQEIIPKRIIVMFDSTEYTTYDLYVALSQRELERKGTSFYIVQASKKAKFDEIMLMCIDKCKAPYFSSFKAGDRCPYNLGQTVHQLINRELARFVSIKSHLDSGNILLTRLVKKIMKTQESLNYELAVEQMVTPNENEELFLQWNN